MLGAVVLSGSTGQVKICVKFIPLFFFIQIKPDRKSVNVFLYWEAQCKTALESIPPERYKPSGLSETSCLTTAFSISP